MKQQFSTNDAPSAPLFLSQAIRSNGFVFVSGQIHNTSDGSLITGTNKEKVSQIFKNVELILKSANLTLDHIVKVVIYVTDMSIMQELNEVYPTYFKQPLPVREDVCLQALPLGASIEISVIAESE